MANVIIVAILVVAVIAAIFVSRKHVKGEGGCCGGGSTVSEHKELEDPVIGEWLIHVDGMHCDNCKNSIERAINRMDGAACEVNLRKKTARVKYSKEIDIDDVVSAITLLDFDVKGYEKV